MFVHLLPKRIDIQSPQLELELPRVIRAPLGLADRTTVYVSLHSRHPYRIDELIISPHPPAAWSDLWRLDIQLYDRPGQLDRLYRIFDENKITVLYHATRDAYRTGFHVKFFVLDCTSYCSDVDGKPADRRSSQSDRLHGLYHTILTHFMTDIRISSDGRPRLELRRNLMHLNMVQDLDRHRGPLPAPHVLSTPIPRTLKNGRIDLSGIQFRESLLASKKTHVALSANTKSQIIYCSLIEADNRSDHLVMYFDRRQPVLQTILQRLTTSKINIVRSQLRSGILGSLSTEQQSLIQSWSEPFTLNLFIMVDRYLGEDVFPYLNHRLLTDLIDAGRLIINRFDPHAQS